MVIVSGEAEDRDLAAGIWEGKIASGDHLLDKESLVEVTKKGGIVGIVHWL